MKNAFIVILVDVPWDWSTDYINQTALYLSKRNTVVCLFWFNALSVKEHISQHKGIRILYTISPNLYGYQGIHILPFRRFPFISLVNLYLNFLVVYALSQWFFVKYHLKRKILWLFDPRLTRLALLFKSRGYFLLYDCVDFWVGSAWDTKEKTEIIRDEKKLLKQSDFVVVNSRVLLKLHQKMRRDIVLVPQGFRLGAFIDTKRKPAISLPRGKPILGYVGGINYRLDFSLIKQLAIRNPTWNFVFVGPMQEVGRNSVMRHSKLSLQRLLQYPNFYYYPNISKRDIPLVIHTFAIGIIPYVPTLLWNKYSYPMKVFEYFYMGKPVVSTVIDELKRFPKFIFMGNTVTIWEKHIRMLLTTGWPVTLQSAQRRVAEKNSWESKTNSIAQSIPGDP